MSAANLVEAQGGNIEPFLWVLLLWLLRRRPLALGACFAIAFMNREFSIYAAPMLLLVHAIESRFALRQVALDCATTALSFLVVFTTVQLLKPHADLLGPRQRRRVGRHVWDRTRSRSPSNASTGIRRAGAALYRTCHRLHPDDVRLQTLCAEQRRHRQRGAGGLGHRGSGCGMPRARGSDSPRRRRQYTRTRLEVVVVSALSDRRRRHRARSPIH